MKRDPFMIASERHSRHVAADRRAAERAARRLEPEPDFPGDVRPEDTAGQERVWGDE